MNEALYFQKVRDNIDKGAGTYTKVESFAEVALELGYNYPFVQSEVTLDSISADNDKAIWKKLNKYGKVLSKKLPDTIEAETPTFAKHHGFKVNGVAGKEKVRYMPFTMTLGDGQVLTALVRNSEDFANYAPKDELLVTKWALNAQDITKEVYRGGDNDIDMATTIARLAKIITFAHTKFVLKNPIENTGTLAKEIDGMVLDLGNVVFETDKTYAEKIKDMEERKNPTKPNTSIDDATAKAVELAQAEVDSGEFRAFASNSEAMKLVEGMKIGDDGLKISKAYADTLDKGRSKLADEVLAKQKKDLDWRTEEAKRVARLHTDEKNIDMFDAENPYKVVAELGDLFVANNEEANKQIQQAYNDEIDKYLEAKAFRFISEYFKEPLSSGDVKNLSDFLNNNDETPDIGSPIMENSMNFIRGLLRGNFMKDSTTFTKAFTNLKNKYKGNTTSSEDTKTAEEMNTKYELKKHDFEVEATVKNGYFELVDIGDKPKLVVGGAKEEIEEYILSHKKAVEEANKPTEEPKPTDAELIAKITEDEVYKQIMKDSHGGVIYNVDNKYDATHLLELWEQVEHKKSQNGIIRGAMNFLQVEGNIQKEDNTSSKTSFKELTKEFLTLTIDDLEKATEIMTTVSEAIEKDEEDTEAKEAYEKMNEHLDGMVG